MPRNYRMNRPTLSVVMPNYNHAQYVAQAIEAIVTQSRSPDEFIIIDDGSTDNSVEIIQEFAHRYHFIDFSRNDRNLGLLATSEKLLSKATGEYLYGAAADDYVLPGFFEMAMDMAEQYPQAGIISGNVIIIDANDNKICAVEIPHWTTPRFVSPHQYWKDYLEKTYLYHSLSSATIYKRTSLEEVGGFRPELLSYCDIFAIQAIGLRHGACYIPQPCACWRESPTGFSSSTIADVRLVLKIIARMADLMRSTQYNLYFPREYVVRCERDYSSIMIRRYVTRFIIKEFGENVFNRLYALWSGATRKKLSNLLFWAYKQLSALFLRNCN